MGAGSLGWMHSCGAKKVPIFEAGRRKVAFRSSMREVSALLFCKALDYSKKFNVLRVVSIHAEKQDVRKSWDANMRLCGPHRHITIKSIRPLRVGSLLTLCKPQIRRFCILAVS